MASIAVPNPDAFVFGVSRSISGRQWRWRGGPPGDAADALRLGISDVTARLFTARGVRVEDIAVRIQLPGLAADYTSLDRILTQFEGFCTVTESVRQGVEVDVAVVDGSGAVLHQSRAGGPAA